MVQLDSRYAFVTFKFAADADCAVVDTQHFPGVQRQLAMGFATPRKKDADDIQQKQDAMLSDQDPCKVFVGGISDRDGEEEVGDFFSQWGLVTLVYRDKANWGFVHFASKEGVRLSLPESLGVEEDYERRREDWGYPPPGGYYPPPPGYYGAPPGPVWPARRLHAARGLLAISCHMGMGQIKPPGDRWSIYQGSILGTYF
ncbi:unnamed protein product [Effrenium voratum]|nr:unnamed protein product [Effrenium voratum]